MDSEKVFLLNNMSPPYIFKQLKRASKSFLLVKFNNSLSVVLS